LSFISFFSVERGCVRRDFRLFLNSLRGIFVANKATVYRKYQIEKFENK